MENVKSDNISLLKTYMSYIALSKYLFSHDGEQVYNINEIKKDNDFYLPAKNIAKELKISWKNMSHEESNRIMLALLEDKYNEMKKLADSNTLEFSVKLKIIKSL